LIDKNSTRVHVLTQLETLYFPADLPAVLGKNFAGNDFPADFAYDLGSQVIPSWVIVSLGF